MRGGADRALVEVRHKAVLSAAVMAGVVMQVLDSTIANVALPHMQASLGATPDSISWVLTSYIIASAMATPVSGWLADRLGMRRLFLLSVGLFVAASVMCGLAGSIEQMVVFRVIQGIAGAALGPVGQSIMLNINRPSDHPRAMSLYGTSTMVGPIVGPVLGGWLTDNFDWRWVFLVNLPVGLACLAGLWWLMPRIETVRRPFDLTGWALLATALAALQLLLDRGEHVDWFASGECWIEAGLALCAFWMFCVHTALARRPLYPPAMLGNRNLLLGCFFMFAVAVVQLAGFALIPSMLQSLLGYPVLTTGFVLATRGLGVLFSMTIAGRLVHRIGARPLVTLGLVLMSYSLWLTTGWSLDMDSGPVIVSGMIQGVAMGLIFLPLTVMTFSTLPAQLRTDGAGLMNLSRSTGGSIGIALATVVLSRNAQISHADLAAHVTPYNLPFDPTLLGGYGDTGEGVLRLADGVINRQAAMIAFLDVFHMMFILSLFAIPLVLLLRGGPAAPAGARNRPAEDDGTPHLVLD
ncbi:DHA2 family efflux MFS transporter permease subunit [Novosphingobium flavum]|uniref:DHA2 family efflux MFS transporter permease subunit n=1 Tax=Novosphingobium aerophilum TaxID=2839843 RepID=UPI00163A8A02|nr:DHA2 family efflux MFS transporter permease subunit [Novosphingobium aerophilum]MBC2660422.1 DHA2 family efflux MFS transporter permease subunit [Novosphingobium aerophilum]